MRDEKAADLGIGALSRSVRADADRIKRRAIGKKVALAGGKSLAVLALALAVLVAFPPLAWPVRGRVTSAFFFRQKPDSGRLLDIEFHKGLDIAAAAGTVVHATAPGLVIEASYAPDLGNYVKIRHFLGLVSTYGHLSRIDVAKGKLIIVRGLDSLGAVGSTGRSTGPHLHFALQDGIVRFPPGLLLGFHSARIKILGF
jgi:murein DD-endopeptidase MepM/ murein hydrolase activator NlpD